MNLSKHFKYIIIAIFFVNTVSVFAANSIANDTCDTTNTENQIIAEMSAMTPEERLALEAKLKREHLITGSPAGIAFYKPTYILPFYYTWSPYRAIYSGVTPDNQAVTPEELKAQLSFKLGLFHDLLGKNTLINIGYTQLMFWQVYAKSQYFRETDYEPEIFVSKRFSPDLQASFGMVHQSNGRGGDLERSWNRAYIEMKYTYGHWILAAKPWILIFKGDSSDLHNPDIGDYLGYGEESVAYKIFNNIFTLKLRNGVESGFSRGAIEFDYSFPIYKVVKGYVQGFSGYGQSLIEYNHYTNALGIGFSLSD